MPAEIKEQLPGSIKNEKPADILAFIEDFVSDIPAPPSSVPVSNTDPDEIIPPNKYRDPATGVLLPRPLNYDHLLTPEKLEQIRQHDLALDELAGRKSKFLRGQVFFHNSEWWSRWKELMDSDDPKERLFAMSEYNKLQIKIIPQEVTGADGEAIKLNITNFLLPDDNINTNGN